MDTSVFFFFYLLATGSSHYQRGPTLSIPGMNERSFLSKRPSTSEVNSINPKKPKPSDGVSGIDSSAVYLAIENNAAINVGVQLSF